ncbi:hypothetical protein AQ1_01006 [alpha proteobacterium Q-1]|nr:hypothetical protein AQ1_01006 [alpha proteobacterium Q-1]
MPGPSREGRVHSKEWTRQLKQSDGLTEWP